MLPGKRAPKQGVDFSGTNVQEEGVDEPDIVKTNGDTLFAVANGKLNAVDVSGAKPRLLDTLKLDPGLSHELLLHGDRLLVLSRGGYWAEPLPAMASRMMPYAPAQSVLAEIDVSNPKALRLVRTLTPRRGVRRRAARRRQRADRRHLAGAQHAAVRAAQERHEGRARRGGQAQPRRRRLLARRELAPVVPDQATGSYAEKARARPVPQRAPAGRLLRPRPADRADGRPHEGARARRLGRSDDRRRGSSTRRRRACTSRPSAGPTARRRNGRRRCKEGVSTSIHKFDISSPVKTQYRGSGEVSGYLLSQWSLSEYHGVLRVVSTESPAWWGAGGETESFLTTLRQRDGGLVQAGRIGGLGKGERVYAVRFVGDVGYVVTFKQIDPLFTLDLANAGEAARARRAEDPRLLGVPASRRRRPAARHRPGRRTRRAARKARSSRSSTSRICGSRPGCTASRSAPAGPRPSPTTTRSSSGRRPGSS